MEAKTYDWYNNQKKSLNQLVHKQLGIVNRLDMDSRIKSEEKPSIILRNLSNRLEDENLVVLIMGLFSSGKSTFVNALLGERILPTSSLPTTAVISIVKYSKNKEIVLFPKPGKWEGGDEPFSIPPTALKQYITIDNESDEKKTSSFEKMELYWDLKICADKIEIVDSPGLDDPDSHDVVTLEYLPQTDAVIYCMSSSHPFMKKDRNTIEELRNLGYTSIIFILTNFDRVQEAAFIDNDDQDEVFVRSMTATLSKLTDLKGDGIFFVNSLHGVLGKERNKPDMLANSGIPNMESGLERFLVNQKGRAKLYKGIIDLNRINKDAESVIKDRLSLNSLSLKELEVLLEIAKEKSKVNNISSVCSYYSTPKLKSLNKCAQGK